MGTAANIQVEMDSLAAVMASRRARSRIQIAGVFVGALVYVPIVTWPVSLAWFLCFAGVRLADCGLLRPAQIRRIPVSAPVRWGSLALLGLSHAVLAGFALVIVLGGAPLYFGLAIGHLVVAILAGVAESRGSRNAFMATLVPHGVAMILGLPFVLVVLKGVPLSQGMAFVVYGLAAMLGSIHFWRIQRALLLAEGDARRTAQAASAAKSAFVATVSHELRTPISAIQAGARSLETHITEPGLRRQATLIVDAGKMMRTLLDDLLDLSKVEAGRMGVETIPFDARALVADTLRFWKAEAQKKKLKLRLAGGRRLPRWIAGDPTRLRQIFNNLMSNALKFTAEGGVAFQIDYEADRIRFAVEDSGPGLSTEQIGRLFTPFAQADATVARTHGGTGLGLALSRNLARLMGGDLTVSSGVGRGARFVVSLPLTLAEPRQGMAVSHSGAAPVSPALRILVADDHEFNRQAMGLILSPLDVETTFAIDGPEALALCERQTFDVILLDLHMPQIGGLEVARRLRAGSGPNGATPIVAVTGAVEDEDRRQCGLAGMAACVAKPIDPAELYAVLAELSWPAPVAAASGQAVAA